MQTAANEPAAMALRLEIFPPDLDATVDFYVDVLGFELVRDERRTDYPYVALARGAARIGAARRSEMVNSDQRRPPVGAEIVLEVDDLEAERNRVECAGWPVLEDLTARPWGLADFRLLDPSGYYIRITTSAATARADQMP